MQATKYTGKAAIGITIPAIASPRPFNLPLLLEIFTSPMIAQIIDWTQFKEARF